MTSRDDTRGTGKKTRPRARRRNGVWMTLRSVISVLFGTALIGALLTTSASADGTETLGPPSLTIAPGNGLVADGVGLETSQPGVIDLDIPTDASVEQVIIYWEGHSSSENSGADDTIEVDGVEVTGTLIGGPTFFFGGPNNRHWSSAYRADITSLGAVSPGLNAVSVGGLSFDQVNNGAGIIVITEDGGLGSSIDIVDGVDLAFKNFGGLRQSTVPQTLTFASAPVDRVGTVTVFASSVSGDAPGDRPNIILVTVDGVVNQFGNVLGSNDGLEWDTVSLPIDIPAGVTSLVVELVSDDPAEPPTGNLPASMAFLAAAAQIPDAPLAALGDYVWFDTNGDGIQDVDEFGVEGVLVELLQGGVVIDSQVTPFGGMYFFGDLPPGDYQVRFNPPVGRGFTLVDQGGDDSVDSDADPTTGLSPVVTLDAGELDITIDAGLIELAPGIDIEKATNGADADDADDIDVPQIAPGDPVTWTYVVTNTGDLPFDIADVVVTDDIIGTVTTITDQGDGDDVLSPGEVWTYEATATNGAEDLANPTAGTVVVDGCNPDGKPVPGDRATYENIGTVTVPGDSDDDPSHYCNPPDPGIDIEKATNGADADGANDIDVPEIAPGDPVTWTYVVTNTGDLPFDIADVVVTDDIIGAVTDIVDQGDGDDVLSPGEVWTYEATATAGAEDLANPTAGTVVVDGCNPDGTPVPGDRATYENIGTVTVPGDSDDDPSHYCNPPDPGIDIEKLVNGADADGANDVDVPVLTPGDPVTFTYEVTNTGDLPFDIADVVVTDDIPGVNPVLDPSSDDGADGVLSPGEVWTYTATDTVEDLANPSVGTVVVDGCNPDGTQVPGDRATYENIGTVTVPGDSDDDPGHYCNPPDPGIDIEKLTNGNQADGADDVDVPQIAPGDPVTWTYVVTNTGDLPFDIADVVVTDDIIGAVTTITDQGDGDDVLSPGEVWTYEATATAGAEDLANPTAGTVIVDGCNPDGTPVPGDRATYENIGTVTVPGDSDDDPSHYCNPPDPGIDIEKLTNGVNADGANDADVPVIAPGDPVTWTYVVTNTGDLPFDIADVVVTDDIIGTVTDITDQGDGDDILAPGEVWTYQATATAGAEDLANPTAGTVIVDGCNPDGTPVPGDRATYENIGTVTVPGDSDDDPSHYCNPPDPGIDIEKATNGNQADGANDGDVPVIAPGDPVTWTYVVTNTGDVPFDIADVVVTDDIIGAITTITDQGDGDDILAPGEVWTYEAIATNGAEDLANPTAGTVVVDGCNPDGTPVPGDRATYENIGTVTVPGDSDDDPSHYCNPLRAALGDFVWLDLNADGVQDGNEPGVEGVLVQLLQGGLVIDSQSTGPDGEYLFDNLLAGDYAVRFTLPSGAVFTLQDQGADDTDSDADPGTGQTVTTNLEPGETDLTLDAGIYFPASLGDYVWKDSNSDGIQDASELGVPDVLVELLQNGLVIDTMMTDDDGLYLFDGLTPGDYQVRFIAPPRMPFTEVDAGSDDAVDSDADPDTGLTPVVTLESGDANRTIDAGLVNEAVCVVIIDEDGIDNDTETIEDIARSHGVEPDFLINDDNPVEVGNPHFRWNNLFPGDVVLIPTGQRDDEGWFALPENTPWSLEDFVNGTVPQSRLDKIADVMPLRNQELAGLIGRTCVAVVYDSDISMNYDPINANLQGARYGLFSFTVLAAEVPGSIDPSKSDTSLYDLWLRVEEPLQGTEKYTVDIHDHEPDTIQIDRARWRNGVLSVIVRASDFRRNSFVTLSVDGADAGGDPNVDPFIFEAPMTRIGSRYEFTFRTPVNLDGRRIVVGTDHGGVYNARIR